MKIQSDNIPASENDSLGRHKLVIEIAKGLDNYCRLQNDGIVVAVTGPWGSGKSTLMEFLAEYIEKTYQNNFKIIRFNPWMFYKDESIKSAFLIEFAISLKNLETGMTQLSKKLNDLIGAFRFVKYINSTAGNIQDGLEKLTESLSKADSVIKIKSEIEEELKQSPKKVLVFIDDIDRLMPDQIMELFQTISLVANFSSVIYVLAFDREIVIDSIDKHFNQKGQDYLEKIVQIDYELPKLSSYKLTEIFNNYIDKVEDHCNILFDKQALNSIWDYHGLKDYFKTLRDFKRFFNSLLFRLPVIADEVNATDFLVIEAIRIFDYNAYERIYLFYSLNYRKRILSANVFDEEQLKEFNSTASDILKALLPQSILNQFREDVNEKRFNNPAYFERYFSLLKKDIDISEKDLRDLMYRPDCRLRILNEALEYNRVKNLIHRLSAKDISKHYPDYDYSLIKELIIFFNSHPALFELHTEVISNMLINLLCANVNYKELVKTFFESFENQNRNKSFNSIHLYFFHHIRNFLKSGDGFTSSHPYFDEYYKQHYQLIEQRYLPVFRDMLQGMLFPSVTEERPYIKYLYQYNFAQLFPNEYKNVLNALLEDKNYVFVIAERLMYIDKETFSLSRYSFEFKDMIFPDDTFLGFYNKISEMDDELLTQKQKMIKQHIVALDLTDFPTIKF